MGPTAASPLQPRSPADWARLHEQLKTLELTFSGTAFSSERSAAVARTTSWFAQAGRIAKAKSGWEIRWQSPSPSEWTFGFVPSVQVDACLLPQLWGQKLTRLPIVPIVYGLFDPRAPAEIRYVGQTRHLGPRWRSHLTRPPSDRFRQWLIIDLFPLVPGIRILALPETCDLVRFEDRWIASLQHDGQADLNRSVV